LAALEEVAELRENERQGPRKVFEEIITKEISWKLKRRICFETIFNIFEVMTNEHRTYI